MAAIHSRTTASGLWPESLAENTEGEERFASYATDNAWKTAPILQGSTNFEPLPDVKNIMVTGGAGFIASWVVRHLTLTYPHAYNVVSFDKLDYCATLNNTRSLDGRPNYSFYLGDLTCPSDVLSCMEKHKIDTVLHFAAQSHVDLSFGNSYSFTRTNVYGTHVLLECATKFGIRRFVHVSTDEVYGEVKEGGDDLVESSILSPTNPYAASKAAAEMLVCSYQASFKLPVIIVRSNNIYGPHQYPEKVIPKFICRLQRGQPVALHGNGSPTRRYLYAGDAADAFDTILHKGRIGQVYNVGSRDEVGNLALCKMLLAAMGLGQDTPEQLRKYVRYTNDRPFNDSRYAVNATKLHQFGWQQRTSLKDGLALTIAWYRRFGEVWWGDISPALEPFPILKDQEHDLGKKRFKQEALKVVGHDWVAFN
ncbi:hypothetical protein PCL_01419 [Purpureocillium lilacinum]|uniref:NAD(P)-binding domain-containing protein n=1 Tax=Purpureocillium lilacinum TaxID=33203 RepID=A0A2U3E3I2_PURLI|nr:hypothetical protein PCL_01419 [Purpureocillium lilacinum]